MKGKGRLSVLASHGEIEDTPELQGRREGGGRIVQGIGEGKKEGPTDLTLKTPEQS